MGLPAGVKSPYRPDIDGLRAFAVVAVVFYHFNPSRFTGGFIGVDVFFVISGFLITGILTADIDKHRFSILKFYERPARRIFPALFFVIALTAIAAWFVLLPHDLYEFWRGVLATSFFVSNLLFASDYGYFVGSAARNPLLHTWSLAVEEQFYVAFPLLLWWITHYFPRHRIRLIWTVAVASFLYSAYLVRVEQSAAFYLAPSRAWELALGSLLALGAFPATSRRSVREGLGLVGACLLIFTLWGISEDMVFPGPAALVPCIGAALIIYAGSVGAGGTLVARALSMRPIVSVGLISYSLYLWHWPVLILYQHYAIAPDWRDRVWLLGVVFGLSYLTWRFVEQPFRGQDSPIRSRQILVYSTVATVLFTIFGGALISTAGSAWRFQPEIVRMADFLGYDDAGPTRVGKCFVTSESRGFDPAQCLALATGKPNYLLVGDSHAAHLWFGLAAVFPEVNFLQATASGCKPVINPVGVDRCTQLINDVYEDFLNKHPVDAILISVRFSNNDLAPLAAIVQALRKYAPRVVVLGPIIEYSKPLPELMAQGAMSQNSSVLAEGRKYEEVAATDKAFKTALPQYGISYISMLDTICPAAECIVVDAQNDPLQFDYGHLTARGSILVAKWWREQHLLP
ncbi:MAG: acyltransferase [Alphaproteobacteria bacterium]|nr:acyltransferase [Alphaproteobacteria bacterium]